MSTMTDSPARQQPSTNSDEPWTTRRLLRWMTGYFEREQIDPARVVSEMLLAHVLECDRTRLYMEADRPASAQDLSRLRELVRRAADREPVQYLVGFAPFFMLDFEINDSTLIPQPSTETLVAHVLEWIRADAGRAASRVLDIGCGCGAIAVALAKHAPSIEVVATDIVAEALRLAASNAERHGVADRIELREGSLYEPLDSGDRFDVICSNPPYIPDHQWPGQVDESVRNYVPETALRGGRDGLDIIRPLVHHASDWLTPGGLLAVEIADCQKDAAIELAQSTGALTNIEVLRDGDGLWRVLRAERPR